MQCSAEVLLHPRATSGRLKAVPFPCVVIWSAEEQVPVRLRKIQKRRTEPALSEPKGRSDPHRHQLRGLWYFGNLLVTA
jgi:hypothetical protein